MARAAKSPNTVEMTAVDPETTSEFRKARKSSPSSHIAANHSVVKPESGKAMTLDLLKANSGSNMIGAYRKTR